MAIKSNVLKNSLLRQFKKKYFMLLPNIYKKIHIKILYFIFFIMTLSLSIKVI